MKFRHDCHGYSFTLASGEKWHEVRNNYWSPFPIGDNIRAIRLYANDKSEIRQFGVYCESLELRLGLVTYIGGNNYNLVEVELLSIHQAETRYPQICSKIAQVMANSEYVPSNKIYFSDWD